MQWNYRIVSEQAPEGEFLQLYEIYYDDGKIIGMAKILTSFKRMSTT